MPAWLALIDPISRIIDKIIPDKEAAARAKLELMREDNQAVLQEMQMVLQADQMQADINKIEAGSDRLFVSGWRPFIGWICGVAFGYHFVLQPLTAFVLAACGVKFDLPVFDMEELSTVLMGMLGLGSLRTWEKVRYANNINAKG